MARMKTTITIENNRIQVTVTNYDKGKRSDKVIETGAGATTNMNWSFNTVMAVIRELNLKVN